jgi:heme exporter protein A
MMRLLGSDLACNRGGRTVFSGLQLAVEAGEALAVVGPNGAGKSSLLRVIAGLVHLSHGRLALEGGDAELTVGEQAHYLGHLDALKPALSVRENLGFWARFLGGSDAEIGPALVAVGLGAITHLPAAYLSAGQRRRLSIARLIAVKRPVWLLDEPTSALDVTAQAALADLMARHLAGGGLILAATHGPLGLERTRELRLGPASPSPHSPSETGVNALTVGEGWGGGSEFGAPHVHNGTTPTPDPSPQGGVEKRDAGHGP